MLHEGFISAGQDFIKFLASVASQDLAGALIHSREGRTVHGHT